MNPVDYADIDVAAIGEASVAAFIAAFLHGVLSLSFVPNVSMTTLVPVVATGIAMSFFFNVSSVWAVASGVVVGVLSWIQSAWVVNNLVITNPVTILQTFYSGATYIVLNTLFTASLFLAGYYTVLLVRSYIV